MRKDRAREEIIASGRDPLHFIRKYVKIRHPQRGLIPFEMFDYQENLIEDYVEHRFNITLKARQLGISEITAAFAAWLMLFHRQKNILVMATKASTAKNIIKKIRTTLRYVPKWLMLSKITVDNVMSIELDNGSTVKAITTSKDAGRSEALSLLILDEAAFIDGLSELWTGLFPTVSAGGRVIVLSTPNGVGNKFHQLYTEAERGDNDFHPTRLMWWVHPERISDLQDDPNVLGGKTSSWFRNEVRACKMSERDIAQELCCDFLSSGETVLTGGQLSAIESSTLTPREMENWDRNTWVWWQPRPGARYMVVADVARGDGNDHSACHVLNVDDPHMEQQAEYYAKSDPEEFAHILVDIGRRYNNALLVVENNSIGLACLEHVRLALYENIYYSRKGDNRPGEAVNSYWGPSESDLVIGFTMSQRTRPLVIAKLSEYVKNQAVIVRSTRTHHELKTFIWNNGRAEAARGANDDLVMSLAVGAWIRDTFLVPSSAAADASKALLGAYSTLRTQNTDIAGASKEPVHARRRDMGTGRPVVHPTSVRLPGDRVVDFGWLLPISKG